MSKSKSKSMLVAGLTIGVASVAAQASTFTLTPVVSFSYSDANFDNAQNANTTTAGGNTVVTAQPGQTVYEIDYYASITNLNPGEAFDAVAWGITYTPGLSISTGLGGYSADSDAYTIGSGKSATKISDIWATANAPAGVTPGNLQDIVASMGSPNAWVAGGSVDTDVRNFIAQPNPSANGYTGSATQSSNDPGAAPGPTGYVPGLGQYVGSVYLSWNGSTVNTLQINDAAATPGNPGIGQVQYQTAETGSSGSVNAGQFAVDTDTVTFGTPEPASLGVLALGGIALLARRRKA